MVRSTTKYERAHQRFRPAHRELASAIVSQMGLPSVRFNNAMVERYHCHYRKMGAHSDQALDLADDSYICLYSCYNMTVAPPDLRQLVVTCKLTGDTRAFLLEPDTAVLFSVADNVRFMHKIVPVEPGKPTNASVWLGVTFRCSKRAVTFAADGAALLETGEALTLLTTRASSSQFYKERSAENASSVPYRYSAAAARCKVSPSDVLPPLDD